MGWPFSLNTKRRPITRQAIIRLSISLGLFVLALSYSSSVLYTAALNKAAHERAEDLVAFYQYRVAQLEREWEIQTRDFKTRIEYTRFLENTASASVNLQAFFTIQGGERHFEQMFVLNSQGQVRFSISKEGHYVSSLKRGETSGWYRDPDNGKLFRVFQESIWLGKEGGGKMLTFFPIDNALLYSLASPGVKLTARYENELVASSLGSNGLNLHLTKPDAVEHREIHWTNEVQDPLALAIEAPVKAIFSTTELSLGAGLIPVIDALILWFALGTWLMLQTRRIKALGVAVDEFAQHQEVTKNLHENILVAQEGKLDEIHDVAVAIEALAHDTVEQRLRHMREEIQIRLWSSVFKSSAEAIIITDRDCNIVDVNPAFELRTGFMLQDVVGKNPRILSAKHQSPEYYQAMWHQITDAGYWQDEVWDVNKVGTPQPYLMTISSVHDAAGVVINYVGYYSDISARIRSDEELKHHRDNLEQLVKERTAELENANQKLRLQTQKLIVREEDLHRAQAVAKLGSWRLDVIAGKLYWSEETYRIFDLPLSEEMTYARFLSAVHEDDRAMVDSKWQGALKGAAYDIEHRIVASGEIKWVREQAEMVFDENGELTGGIGTVHDVTERKLMEEQIRQLAFYDALTNLPNRHLLSDRMSQIEALSKRSGCYAALMFLDLDNFKPLNDTHGHVMGDLLLIEVASRIKNCVREVDTVARFGGDEFIVILRELNVDKAESVLQASISAEKIRAALSEPYLLTADGSTPVNHHCGASIGVVVFQHQDGSHEDILKMADIAMYQAKEAGRNLIRFYGVQS